MKDKNRNTDADVLIGLGSNLDPEQNLLLALSLLTKTTRVAEIASIWQSSAVGHSGPDYLNTAVLITTALSPSELQATILRTIEDQLGRVRGPDKYMDRTIDLDILVYAGDVIDSEIWEQAHVSIPAAEIFPDLMNPITGLSLIQTATELKNKIDIKVRVDLTAN